MYGRRTVTRPWLASLRGTGALGLRRGPYKTSQVGPFCLAASFLWLQQECGLRNLAPVAWHLVKLIHRQETNCQIKWVSSSLPLPSRLWMGRQCLPSPFLSPALFPPCRSRALGEFVLSHKRCRISTRGRIAAYCSRATCWITSSRCWGSFLLMSFH